MIPVTAIGPRTKLLTKLLLAFRRETPLNPVDECPQL
jgi:hypothetical protein